MIVVKCGPKEEDELILEKSAGFPNLYYLKGSLSDECYILDGGQLLRLGQAIREIK